MTYHSRIFQQTQGDCARNIFPRRGVEAILPSPLTGAIIDMGAASICSHDERRLQPDADSKFADGSGNAREIGLPPAGPVANSFDRSARWQDIRTGFAVAAAILAIALSTLPQDVGGLVSSAHDGTSKHVQGARSLERTVWRQRDKTGSAIGEETSRDSGEPADSERTVPRAWSIPVP